MIGPKKQLYEKDGAEFKPINPCDCEGSGGNDGGSLPDSISATASAYSSDTPEAEANVNPETGVFTFRFGLPRGEQGPPGTGGGGIEGDIPVAHKSVMVFRTYVPTDDNPKPARPVGGSWDVENDIITYPKNWGPTDNVEKPVWMSTGEFSSADPADPKWSDPIMISGEDGTNGTDGVATEFIYKLTETALVEPTKPESINETEHIPDGWTDSPSGISEEMQCEWVCTRKKDDDGNWSSWDGPVIWAKWGVNGTDGDGVEYIYKVNKGEVLDNPTPSDTSTDEYQSKGEFEGKEYIPEGWTDEPTGVSKENTHEWVCVRKQKSGVWQGFSNPALWARFGEQGNNGISIRTMYAKTASSDEPPVFVQDNINPGSIWGLIIPFYESPEAVWSITAYVTYDNKLAEVETVDEEGNPITVYGWQGPILVSGVSGKDGTPVNYKTYVYKLSDIKPDKPTSNDPNNPGDGWVDYPNTTGQWWQCIGTVNGVTELVTEWSEVLPVNGQDGTAQDGKRVEFRFAVNSSQTDAPAINKSIRQPSGWTTQPPTKEANQFMWMTVATINPDDTLAVNWSDPVCISGEQGPQGFDGPAGPPGPMGPNGISGIPGKDIEARYCLGTENTYIATYNSNVANVNDPTTYGWLKTVPSVTKEYPYIWCIQTSFVYERAEEGSESYVRTLEYPWPEPFRLSGVNGLPGERGKSQIIYPAGIYDNSTSYTADNDKAPYVFDTSDNNFYVLNYKGTWLGTEQDNRTPSQDYAENKGEYWMLMQSFDAIYANIGVFGNALVGSAVFNGHYMFSQQGITASGAATSAYNNFNASDPYNNSNSFRPNLCLNLVTGEAWFGAGAIHLYKDGTGAISMSSGYDQEAMGALGTFITQNKLEFANAAVRFRVGDGYQDKGVFALSSAVTNSYGGATEKIIINVFGDGSGYIGQNQEIYWGTDGVVHIGGLKITEEGIGTDSDGLLSESVFIGKNGIISAGTITNELVVSTNYQRINTLRYDGKSLSIESIGSAPNGGNPDFSNLVYFRFEDVIFKITQFGIKGSKDGGNTWVDLLEGGGSSSGGSGNIEFVEDIPDAPKSGVLYVFI